MKYILPLAVFISIFATFGIYKYMQIQKEKVKNARPSLQTVVIAIQDLKIGKKLEETDLSVKEWPVEVAPKGALSNKLEAVGRVVKTEVYSGEAILEAKLAPKGSEGGFASIIPTGMRAITVQVNTYSGVGGFILPNTHVDVLVTVPSPDKKEESSTKIILEDVKVLAVDQTFERERDEPIIVQSVTLLVTPEESEKLALASAEGKLSLILRNDADRAMIQTSGVRLKELVSQSKPSASSRPPSSNPKNPPPPEVAPEQKVVEVIRSSERTQVKFESQKETKKLEKKE
jgi:pilus assembly protein CpaB